ncbi:GreA/GreB family elongation factor [Marinomonas sp. M1K-6]|uniref:GreA/GreB family elongation factor n=1 Tax=Marinomonas profundi TaxID=2726122 RepID=A0A847R5P1_9GAMM|nr:GreA/GreB family elongation factor [Marinomonas profundi]NLQ16357.1 GreA/GreB family elongation factor [Marinomonas profundi]UDV03068.1 GreA/GreB family elongation factor [Marinomonas profundi]
MNKQEVHEAITSALLCRFETATWAAKQAHEAATNEESIAENKYDTFGLEASYLAHGQSQRVLECEKDWQVFNKNPPALFSEEDAIDLWCMVTLLQFASPVSTEKHFFMSPCAGGLAVEIDEKVVYLVTSSSPVGKSLLGKTLGDEIELLQNGKQIAYEITMIG